MSAVASSPSLLPSDDRPRGRRGLTYRRAWSFKDETEPFLAGLVRDLPHPWVHCFSGASRLGDIRVDLVHPDADIHGDVADLVALLGHPVPVIIADPPWAAPYALRWTWIKAMRDALEPGGTLVLYAPWMPAEYGLELQDAFIRRQTGWRFPEAPVVASIWRKTEPSPFAAPPRGS